MEYIFHEIQDGSLCAQHCLNSLLQGDYFSAVDLANIAHELDRIELNYMSEAGTMTNDYQKFLNQESSNYDDTGFFSIQVIQKALSSFNLELIQFNSPNRIAVNARQYPTEQKAYICNFKHHWYAIRKIANYWFNLNSMFKKPELISDTYLSVLLAQLQNDGHSIFIVEGELPRCQAEFKLTEFPIDVKKVLAEQNKQKSMLKKSLSPEDYDDEELKKAIRMSLAENDLDLDSHNNMLYPSLAYESSAGAGTSRVGSNGDDEEDFKRAIAMSLETPQSQLNKDSKLTNPVESAEEIRKKRLEFLNKNSNNN